jgi:hypothetical protein
MASDFTGFANVYEKYRPGAAGIFADLLLQSAGMDRADPVVDLGCGTGGYPRWTGKLQMKQDEVWQDIGTFFSSVGDKDWTYFLFRLSALCL